VRRSDGLLEHSLTENNLLFPVFEGQARH
jgi:hypothetical protein